LRDNLLLARPGAADEHLIRCLEQADLGDFLNRHPRHLDMPIEDGGRTWSPGIRRRLGLARALVTDGTLYLLDEPSEGLDRQGCQVVYQQLIALAQRGRTLIIATHDPLIIAGASCVIDLDGGACTIRQPAPVSVGNGP
jgi:ATP-binding cassette subfamily C protein LapB